MNRYFAAALIAVSPTLIHAEDCCMPCYTPGEILCDDQACATYTTYAGIDLSCGWNVFAWGEFLYWQLLTDTYVAISADAFPVPVDSTQTELSNRTPYKPAFRVGIGTVLHCFDDWVLNVDYTWYHHTFSNTYTAQGTNLLASTLNSAPYSLNIYNSIRTKMDYNYDIVGMNIQRPNYMGRSVILSPFIGLKWLKRESKITQFLTVPDGSQDQTFSQLDYSSVGVGAGFDGGWLLCWGLRLIGKADVSLFYAYKRKFLQRDDIAEAPPFFVKQKIKHLDIWGKGGMGLGWGSYFCCNRYHVDLSATFDFTLDVVKLNLATGFIGSTEFPV